MCGNKDSSTVWAVFKYVVAKADQGDLLCPNFTFSWQTGIGREIVRKGGSEKRKEEEG
jgi:hypothetical protein